MSRTNKTNWKDLVYLLQNDSLDICTTESKLISQTDVLWNARRKGETALVAKKQQSFPSNMSTIADDETICAQTSPSNKSWIDELRNARRKGETDYLPATAGIKNQWWPFTVEIFPSLERVRWCIVNTRQNTIPTTFAKTISHTRWIELRIVTDHTNRPR